MSTPLRVLIVDDSEDDALLLIRELKRGGYDPVYERVDTAEALSAALDRQTWDIVFGDYSMPHFNGVAALRVMREKGLDIPFIFVSGTIGEDTAVEAMRNGANDYIMKSNMKRLLPTVERELREAQMRLEHRQIQEMVQHMAYYDTLTQLPNRNMLYDRLLNAIRTNAEGRPMALLLLDLNHFKEINDTLGHYRGDFLLQEVGARLRSVLFEPDVIARLGGDEFAILLPRLAAPDHVNQVAQKIHQTLEAPFMVEGLPVAVEASIGIAMYPDHGGDPYSLMQRADVAMYVAKQTGVGYAVYAPAQDQHSPRRLALMGELRQAIEQSQLFLQYQPQVDMKTKRVIGVEALVRWRHPEHGLIPPNEFILPAERTGLIKPLTLWVFNTAQSQCQAWHRKGIELPVSINLSVRNLLDPQFPDLIAKLLQPCGGRTDRLELEITESAIMADPTHALEAMNRLKGLGLRFTLDDFGTGYSSLSYLSKLPVDTIKIDKSFVMNIARASDEVIVRSTIDLAHNLGRKVVAEGVENQEIWDRLVVLGCDAAQGYLVSRPLDADRLERWLKESPYSSLR
jgi:diguanylate cyclase (GGDEF)-like protein